MSFTKFASVILELSINKILDYGVSEEQALVLKKGMSVEVPVKGKLRRGFVFAVRSETQIAKVLPIAAILSEQALISEELFDLALWMAKYYHAPLSKVIKCLLPASIREQIEPKEQLFITRVLSKEELRSSCEKLRSKNPAQSAILDVMLNISKGILLTDLLEKTGLSRGPVDTLQKKGMIKVESIKAGTPLWIEEEYFKTKPKKLNAEQVSALEPILKSIQNHLFETHLLHGVTGSGKTEVYLQAISMALEQDKGVIMLIPEISLTAQTVERFRGRFQSKIAILHHRLSQGERFCEWHKIKRGDAKIVIGARSAIFCPVHNLGLIIVDEEHEHTYKQTDELPCYHARDVAVMRGYLQKATVLLGSATPSLESYYNVEKKKYLLSNLSKRAETASMPKVQIVDMRREYEKRGGFTLFSEALLSGIKERQEIGEQTILFLNRRGYHTTQLCTGCGHTVQCPHCDLNLTFHLGDNAISCHLCGFTLSPPPKKCEKCGSLDTLNYRGVGTEQVERALHAVFPEIRTLRIDADTTRHKGSHEKLLREFRTGKADVLIGTQMIAKGLHFPTVTLVGVINSDSSLNIPDFRASENVFQLITQVSGRSGRGFVAGQVVIQSLLKENPTIQFAALQDYLGFYKEEIEVRKLFGYPPFTHMVKVVFTGSKMQKVLNCANLFHHHLQQKLSSPFFLNPVIPAGYAKVKDKFRFQFIVRGPSIYSMNEEIHAVREEVHVPSDVSFFVDVDPLSTFF
ncbi:MAG: primosomal protein N' [Chlamydiales bacterium]|nr:primosomal protein N' [Chlamydiales bacterium]